MPHTPAWQAVPSRNPIGTAAPRELSGIARFRLSWTRWRSRAYKMFFKGALMSTAWNDRDFGPVSTGTYETPAGTRGVKASALTPGFRLARSRRETASYLLPAQLPAGSRRTPDCGTNGYCGRTLVRRDLRVSRAAPNNSASIPVNAVPAVAGSGVAPVGVATKVFTWRMPGLL